MKKNTELFQDIFKFIYLKKIFLLSCNQNRNYYSVALSAFFFTTKSYVDSAKRIAVWDMQP